MSKIKEVMLLALVADGSIEMKIADAGKVVNTIYDALKANGLLVASGKKKKKREKGKKKMVRDRFLIARYFGQQTELKF